jgi:hypothetical protein
MLKSIGLPELLVIAAVSILFVVRPFWIILKRVGMNPWISVFVLLPIANLLVFHRLAYSKWPKYPI